MSDLKHQILDILENSKDHISTYNGYEWKIDEEKAVNEILKLIKPVILINVSDNTIESNTDIEIHVLDKIIKQVTPIVRTPETLKDIICNLYNINL